MPLYLGLLNGLYSFPCALVRLLVGQTEVFFSSDE